MRILPINNNFNKNIKNISNKINKKNNFSLNKAMAIGGAALILTSGYVNRNEWKKLYYEIKKDCIENVQQKPIQRKFDTQAAALNYAFDVVTNHLINEGKEYSVHINNNKHKIISECAGTDSSVMNYAPLRMLYNKTFNQDFTYTAIHGHPPYPNGATSTFSFTDFNNFITHEACSESYVVNKDRNFCRFKKTENYKKPTPAELEQLKYDYDVMVRVSKFNYKIVVDSNNKIVFKIMDEPAMHSFWERMCKKFGIEYTTTFGVYGLYDDIYANGYHEGFIPNVEINNDYVPLI